MSGVDVLAVMDAVQRRLDDSFGNHSFPEFERSRAAVAELIDAAEAYAEAEAALANRELHGINAESIDRLQPRVHDARRDLEFALARVTGAAA